MAETMTVEMYYKEHEKNTIYAALIRQWAERWDATASQMRLRNITADDKAFATGEPFEHDEMLDYLDGKGQGTAGVLHFFYEKKNGGGQCNREHWAIIAIHNGRNKGGAEFLKERGYKFDTKRLLAYITEQKRLDDALTALVGEEYD